MKRIVLCLALVMCGCELNGIEQPKPVELRFTIGDIVDLKIGGKGQIVGLDIGDRRPYWVRIRTDAGIERVWLYEFELEIK